MGTPYIHIVHVIHQDASDPRQVIVLSTDSDNQLRHHTLPKDHPAVSAAAWCKPDGDTGPPAGNPEGVSALGSVKS